MPPLLFYSLVSLGDRGVGGDTVASSLAADTATITTESSRDVLHITQKKRRSNSSTSNNNLP